MALLLSLGWAWGQESRSKRGRRVLPGSLWALEAGGGCLLRVFHGIRSQRGFQPRPTVSCATFWQAVRHSVRAPFLISLFHPHKPRKSCKVRRNAGICSRPQNRADIVPAAQFSAALILSTTQMVPVSFQRLSVAFQDVCSLPSQVNSPPTLEVTFPPTLSA